MSTPSTDAPTTTDGPERVEMWFDPSCPWTWLTSRWLVDVAEARGFDVGWHVMSLGILNEGQDVPEQYREAMGQAGRALRVLAAAGRREGAGAVGRLYTELGTRAHDGGRGLTTDVLTESVAAAGLDVGLADAQDDESLDAAVRESHQAGQDAVGDSVGSPVVSVDGRAFFGPVMTPVARGQEGLDLFDGLRLLAGTSAFSELKRARNGPPSLT
ncbi:mycothiol-dependent nitroreductase Rv2466c family protein [Aquipuribacter sp. SD81]|uniref:mycothiol-dependent nitroreductase Rv2466c family protein n=1 Tax=Aquipuribacter sp. SD81 TaxID=3127703 RepID=UPI003015A87F